MNAIIPHAKLIAALEATVGVAKSHSDTHPQLSNLLVEVRADTVFLTGNDLETSVRQSIPAQVTSFGALTVPAKAFSALVRSLPDADVTLYRKKEGLSLQIDAGGVHFSLAGLAADDFPAAPTVEGTSSRFLAEQAPFRRALELTAFAASKDEKKEVLCGISFLLAPDKLVVAATDGRRLARTEVLVESKDSGTFTLPRKTVDVLRKATKGAGKIRVTFNKRQAKFLVEQGVSASQPTPTGVLEVTSRLYAKDYPAYQTVIPTARGCVAVLSRMALADAVGRAELVAGDSGVGTAMRLDSSKLKVTTRSGTGTAEEEIKVEGKDLEYRGKFNPLMLSEAIGAVDQDQVSLEFLADRKLPIRLTTTDYLFLFMPMVDPEK